MQTISLNGEPKIVPPDCSIAALIRELGLEGKRIAVECNGEIVPKSLHANHLIQNGDRIEIVAAVGGG